MRVIISYMARDDDGDGAMHTYIQHTTHTHQNSHMLSSAHLYQHMHACACMLSRPHPPHTAMRDTVYATTRTPHTPQYTHCTYISAVQPHTHTHIATHTQPPTRCNTHTTTYNRLRVPPRSRRDRRQERQSTQAHITPTPRSRRR